MKPGYLLTLVLAAVLAVGCIRDDRSDCSCDVCLTFVYYGDGDEDIFPEKITKVNMYVYSATSENLVKQYTYDQSALANNQGAQIDLMPGDYHIVCWGNAYDQTKVETSLSDGYVSEKAFSKASSDYSGTDSLYFSRIELNVPESLEDVNETCPFESSHIKMKVKLTGFVGAISADGDVVTSVAMVHTGCPAMTDFTNEPSDTYLCDVVPSMSVDPDDSDSYILRYNVLRFEEADPLTLVISSQDDETLYTVDLTSFISDNEIEVDGVQEVTVPVLVRVNGVGVEVLEWLTETVTPGFGQQ